MMGLVCKKALKKRRYSAKETHNFKEPTNRSHPIVDEIVDYLLMKISRKFMGRPASSGFRSHADTCQK